MLRHVLFDLELFATSNEAERDNSQKRVLILLECLVNCNRYWLWQHPDAPLIYHSGIKYKVPQQMEPAKFPEVATVREWLDRKKAPETVTGAFKALADMCGAGEHFREIPRIIENGGGDCDNVASWRVAELRELGIWARPYITWRERPDGGTTYHVIVRWPDGSSEDPSLLLGMGGDAKTEERLEEERKLAERCSDYINGLKRKASGEVLGVLPTQQSNLPSDFGKGVQYSIPFMTDDAYEDWSPARPQAFYANPLYPGLTPQSGPVANMLWRDQDGGDFEDREDRFDGDDMAKALRRQQVRRRLGRLR